MRTWILAIGGMGKDAKISAEGRIERCLRLLKDAGRDDDDPEYDGPSPSWPAIRQHLDERLRASLEIVRAIQRRHTQWIRWLPLDRETGRMSIGIAPPDLQRCIHHSATEHGAWPTSPTISTEMLRTSTHPEIQPGKLDLSPP